MELILKLHQNENGKWNASAIMEKSKDNPIWTLLIFGQTPQQIQESESHERILFFNNDEDEVMDFVDSLTSAFCDLLEISPDLKLNVFFKENKVNVVAWHMDRKQFPEKSLADYTVC